MRFSSEEILETVGMIADDKLDIRTVTLGISLWECADPDLQACGAKTRQKILDRAGRLTEVARDLEKAYGIPIVNTRVSLTPLAMVVPRAEPDAFLRSGPSRG